MDNKDLEDIVKSITNNRQGLEFIIFLLEKLGAFERGCKFDNVYCEYYNRGKREQGLWLLDLIKDLNFEKYIEIEKIRSKNLWQMNKTRKTQED